MVRPNGYETVADRRTPNWHPITALPLLTELIEGTLADTKGQLENLEACRERPHVLDDELVNRVIRSYSKSAEFLPIYREQLERWEQLDLAAQQRHQVERLKTKVASLGEVLSSLIELAHELKSGTIDSILRKSDVEVALDVLSGKLRPPF